MRRSVNYVPPTFCKIPRRICRFKFTQMRNIFLHIEYSSVKLIVTVWAHILLMSLGSCVCLVSVMMRIDLRKGWIYEKNIKYY